FGGVPPPATFDIYSLPDTAPLTDLEVCSVLRVSTNTTASWRRRGLHLKWLTLPNGQVRSTAGSVKALLAKGETRSRASDSPPPATIDKVAPRDRRSKGKPLAQPRAEARRNRWDEDSEQAAP